MNPQLISRLICDLASVPPSATVMNPYYRSSARCKNLGAYLSALCACPYSGHLFVGEAPGYRGCAVTGIPFTSERVLRSRSHRFLSALWPLLSPVGDETEPTATIVWEQVRNCQTVPAFWNVFPFHPHPKDVPNRNRKPNASEKAAGRPFLDLIVQIFAPHTLVAVGKVAASVTTSAFPHLKHVSLRHPANGGKAGFVSGFAALHIV